MSLLGHKTLPLLVRGLFLVTFRSMQLIPIILTKLFASDWQDPKTLETNAGLWIPVSSCYTDSIKFSNYGICLAVIERCHFSDNFSMQSCKLRITLFCFLQFESGSVAEINGRVIVGDQLIQVS